MKKNQEGFGVVGVLIVIVMLVAAGFAGWKVMINNKKPKASTATTTTKTEEKKTTEPEKVSDNSTAGYLVIKEWNVKIKMKDADKATYTYDASQKGQTSTQTDGTVDSTIGLAIKPEYLKDKTCDVSVGYTRYSKLDDSFFKERAVEIGGYYYLSSGSPYACSNAADNTLTGSLRSDFGNIEALQFQSDALQQLTPGTALDGCIQRDNSVRTRFQFECTWATKLNVGTTHFWVVFALI